MTIYAKNGAIPTQPRNRSEALNPRQRIRRPRTIITQICKNFNKTIKYGFVSMALVMFAAIVLMVYSMSSGRHKEKAVRTNSSAIVETIENIKHIVTSENQTAEILKSTEASVFYLLTDAERELIEFTISAECRGESYDGQVAVCQCLLNACIKDNIRPAEAMKKYHYTVKQYEPTESIKSAVSSVFDCGEVVTDEPIIYFYNPTLTVSAFHESQDFVIEIGAHRFFKESE